MLRIYFVSRKKVAALACAGLLILLLFMLTGQLTGTEETSSGGNEQHDSGLGSLASIFKTQRMTKQIGDRIEDLGNLLPKMHSITNDGRFVPPRRVVHLDLKGAPPKMSYIQQLLPIISKAGATDLLVEYEDMFPYWGPLKNISAVNAYSKKEVETLLSLAETNHLTVIPLVQTFGHLEFVLKLEEYQHLREVPSYPQSLCPTNEEGWDVVSGMLDQILEVHTAATHIHIGCDEVYQLGQCSQCLERLSSINTRNTNIYHDSRYLFLQHVKRIAEKVVERGRVPIIWDDMLRNLPKTDLKDAGLGDLVEPMVWVYVEDIDRFVDSVTWRTYSEVFKGIWTASAFKGAFGERLYVANMFRHYENHLSWLDIMYRESTDVDFPINFKGIALTGWSRYDHFAALCELLPVAVPSLVMSLAVLTSGKGDIHTIRKVNEILQCSTQKNLMLPDELRRNPSQWDLYRCSYPGVKAFSLISSYHNNRGEVNQLYSRLKEQDGWMSDWHVNHRFSSPYRVEEALKSSSYLPGIIRDLEKQANRILSLYFDKYTVEEWIEQNILPLSLKMTELGELETLLTKPNNWPRRPITAIQQ